jgi:hypothetical protein
MDCGSLLPLCCHSLLWSRVWTRQRAKPVTAMSGL